ncbi:MAG: energy transducer TonB [Vicinamibacteria bacterium]
MSLAPEFFTITEAAETTRLAEQAQDRTRARVASGLTHFLIIALMLLPATGWFAGDEDDSRMPPRVRFPVPGGEGESGGGGGGGSGGRKPTAFIPLRFVKSRPPAPVEPVEVDEPTRRAPLAPRKPKPFNFDDLDVPDLPDETEALFAGLFSPDAVDLPGLSLDDSRDWGGVDTEPSSGSDGGMGGGEGSGVGPGEGWGVGPGRGGGYGGGDFSPGSWDSAPIPIYEPPAPPYPSVAREKMVAGEVILQVLVKLDGSTEVVRVVKSLPFCVDAAKENARLWRWKPALKNGKPVEALGIITVTFDIFAQGSAKS